MHSIVRASRALALAGLMLWAGSASAQQADLEALLRSYGFDVRREGDRRVVDVTLQQVLQLALERNLNVQSVRVSESIASSALEAARERLQPKLTNSASYARSQAATLSVSSSNFLNLGGTDAMQLSSAYSKPTEAGIEYSLTYTERRARPLSSTIASAGGDQSAITTGSWLETSALTGSVSIPIGQDYGREYQELPVRRAETGLSSSRLGIQQRELELIEVAAATYWDLVAARDNVRVQEDAVRLSEQLLQDNRLRLNAGVLSPFDVQVTEAQLARERQALITTRATVLRIEDLARALLNVQVIDVDVRPVDRPQAVSVELDHARLLEQVYANSTDLRLTENQLVVNGLNLADARNKERTNLDLQLYYTLQGFNGSPLGGVEGFTQTGLDSYGAALTWTIPLFDVATRESIRQRTLERQQIELQLESLRSDLNVRLQGVIRQIRVAREQVETSVVARRLAGEQLKNEIERFRVGESTSFQVSQAQQEAAQAQVQENLSRLSLERNHLALLVLTGEIYNRYGLERRTP